MGSDHDHSQIVKGKRAKRQRSSSPFGFAVTDSSSSGYSGDDCYYNNNSISLPTTSDEIYESTEEEEDMANCLIMLAQGDRPTQIIQENIGDKVQQHNTSQKFTAKTGLYVYDCKTCNRSFPSFQALGGHRASHKKPKATLGAEKKSTTPSPSILAVAAVVPIKDDFNSDSPILHHHNNKSNKIHECSICGSEFTSGQALGGHMRRHRAAAVNPNQGTTIESNIVDVKPDAVAATTRSILPLDLNLPAPEDDHHIRFGTTQQPSLVFSAPALVDCHY